MQEDSIVGSSLETTSGDSGRYIQGNEATQFQTQNVRYIAHIYASQLFKHLDLAELIQQHFHMAARQHFGLSLVCQT
jgi:hypothetical protein